jgi:hypothetical protein
MRDRFALAYARSLPLCFCFVNRRHPRALARIRPTQLGLWSFAVTIAHGAGLMLVPIYLGLCRAADLDEGHEAAARRILGVASLPLPGPQVRVPELVQSRYDLGRQPHSGRRSLACDQLG